MNIETINYLNPSFKKEIYPEGATLILPSTIVNDQFHIGCNNGIICPTIVQREGKKPMNADEFLRGFEFVVSQKINA